LSSGGYCHDSGRKFLTILKVATARFDWYNFKRESPRKFDKKSRIFLSTRGARSFGGKSNKSNKSKVLFYEK
jgi:hypothetical protein